MMLLRPSARRIHVLNPKALQQLCRAYEQRPAPHLEPRRGLQRQQARPVHSTSARMAAASSSSKDWSATQYLKFGNERTRPVHDLAAQLPLVSPPRRIIDLGCGPGNSTEVLASRFPDAVITGVDSSPDMLSKARVALPSAEFLEVDLRTYSPSTAPSDEPADLLFSNAVYQWLRRGERIPTVLRLLRTQAPGGVFAFQVPDNYYEPSHCAMRDTAAEIGRPWTEYFCALHIGELDHESRPDLDPIETPAQWYDALIPHSARVDIWRTQYHHILASPRDIVEWVKATGLRPFVDALPEGEVRDGFLAAYEERLKELYPPLADGRVMLPYPRLFVVAVRK